MFKGGAVIEQLRPLDAGRVLVPSEGSYPYAREFDSHSRKSVFFLGICGFCYRKYDSCVVVLGE